MRIEQPHSLGRHQAILRIDQFLDGLVERPPGGVTISNPKKDWDDGRMAFSFTAAKGFFGVPIAGVMEVTDSLVVMQSELPVLLTSVFGEDRIAQVVGLELKRVLSASPTA
jgi:hypothetical protein